MKKLPLSYSEQPSGECWTFYKFAILKANPIAAPWISTHIEFYINENMCGGYGNADCDYYKMRYYNDILSMTRIPVIDTTADKIVPTICKEIDDKHYIILYLNFNRFSNLKDISLHELLIYGYDEEKRVFYCSYLINGRFKEVEISFEKVKVAYNDAREYYMQDGWQLLARRNYYFGITSLHIRTDYQNDNFVADLIDKIDHEIHGQRIIQTDLSENFPKDRVCYTGSACFIGLSNCITNVIEKGVISKTLLWRLIRTLKMMSDYRILFLSAMDWFSDTVKGENNSGLITVRNLYEECATEIQRCYLMLCKYEQTGHMHLLENTKSTLDTLHKKEIEILSNYREIIFTYYYQINGVPAPQDV